MSTLLAYKDVLAPPSKRILLLGNGFSVALLPDIFTYNSLYKNADFSTAPEVRGLFDALDTTDFELIIRRLQDASKIMEIIRPKMTALATTLRVNADVIKEALVKAIASRHPARPYDIGDEKYVACRRFLRGFDSIFSLNYDVLLYWTLMHDEADGLPFGLDDGFRHPPGGQELPYVSWQQGNQAKVQYLHGALHLFDAGTEIIKYTWSKTELPIIDQIRSALQQDKFPLFVSEGESDRKLRRILHNAYLHKCFRSFEETCKVRGKEEKALFVFGHSMSAVDSHILQCIARGAIPRMCVSIYGDPDSSENVALMSRAQALSTSRPLRKPLKIEFFDASSANVWG